MWFRKRHENVWLGTAAGLAGGLLGSVAISKFDGWWAHKTNKQHDRKGTGVHGERGPE